MQNALRALQSDHLSSPSFPQHGSFNHIYLTFSLLKIIYTLLSKNVASRIFALLLAKKKGCQD